MVIGRCSARSAMTNALVWVLFFVCICINYPGRPGAGSFFNHRPVHIHSVIMNINSTWPVSVINFIDLRALVRKSLYILGTRACNISSVISGIGIINNGGSVYNIYHSCMRHIIIINIRAVNISLRRAYPIIIRDIVITAKA